MSDVSEQITQVRAIWADWRTTSTLLLSLVAHAEDVLERHHVESQGYCNKCEVAIWPCPEVAAVIKAWTP